MSPSTAAKLGHLDTLAKMASRGRMDLTRSISAIVPLKDIATGIEMLEKQQGNTIRILVKP